MSALPVLVKVEDNMKDLSVLFDNIQAVPLFISTCWLGSNAKLAIFFQLEQQISKMSKLSPNLQTINYPI